MTSKKKTLDDDSSDDDLIQLNSYCIINSDVHKQSIYSYMCKEPGKIKFDTDSFAFHATSSCITLQFSQIFLWRLVNRQKISVSTEKQIDSTRLMAFYSQYMSRYAGIIRFHVYENMVSYSHRGLMKTIETPDFYKNISMNFNYLYEDIRRRYNSIDKVEGMLTECVTVLCFISGS